MKPKPQRGYTLIELMVVVVIIGVFAALAAAQLGPVNHRNRLTNLVAQVQQIGSRARAVALQTRRAAVVEFDERGIWLNLLSGANCWSAQAQKCAYDRYIEAPGGGAPLNIYLLSEELMQSEVVMCGGWARVLDATNSLATINLPATGFALCYSGAGELWVRAGTDDDAVCGEDPAEGDVADWARASGAKDPDPQSLFGIDADLHDGAMIGFNRTQGRACDDNPASSLDVRQAVFFPSGGSPFSRTAPTAAN